MDYLTENYMIVMMNGNIYIDRYSDNIFYSGYGYITPGALLGISCIDNYEKILVLIKDSDFDRTEKGIPHEAYIFTDTDNNFQGFDLDTATEILQNTLNNYTTNIK